tara:strand:- start:660 stop:1208 length:549 start_codon:yes stop_codon:yes gene_type:complete
MRHGKCTAGVNQITVGDYHYNDEIRMLLANLNQMGVEVNEAIPQYFVDEYRALYYSDVNRIYLNKRYTDDPGMFIRALRHEGWHAAQDCMGGGMHNSEMMPMLEATSIPDEVIQDTFARYGFDPSVVRIEREAVWAMDMPWMTVDALEACNSDTPIWETYFPPKRTWSYLYWEGLVDYHDGI